MNKIIEGGEEFYRKIETLKEVKIDALNWVSYYVDESSGEKWAKEYPHSEYHGGGAPQLRSIEKFPWE
jgi:immunity protein 27 of polymorphic toxin system